MAETDILIRAGLLHGADQHFILLVYMVLVCPEGEGAVITFSYCDNFL